jgi:hypothetical protein
MTLIVSLSQSCYFLPLKPKSFLMARVLSFSIEHHVTQLRKLRNSTFTASRIVSIYFLCLWVILRRFFSNQVYIASNDRVISERWTGKDLEGSDSGLFLWYYTDIHLDDWRKTVKILSQNSWYPGRDLNLVPPVCEAGMLTNRPRCSVRSVSLW